MAIRSEIIPTVTAVGTAGTTATGTKTSSHPVNGQLASIGIAQGNTPHANTDITITTEYGGKVFTLLTLTNYNTTALTWHHVRAAVEGQTGTALTYDGTNPVTDKIPLAGTVTVTVAQGGSAATCDVVVVFDDGR